MTLDKFNEIMAMARARKKMTRRELSEKTGISINQLFKLENNLSSPSIRTVLKISEILGIVWKCDLWAKLGE